MFKDCASKAARRFGTRPSRPAGFTLIELLVVLAILALLLTIATPKYIQHIERAREATLRSSLKVMRESIDKFYGDQGRWPASLDELVARQYLKAIPVDPITDKTDTWTTRTESDVQASLAASSSTPSYSGASLARDNTAALSVGVADVHSGADGKATDGSAYADW